MFITHDTPKVSKKRGYPGQPEEYAVPVSSYIGPILKKNKFTEDYALAASMSNLHIRSNCTLTCSFKSGNSTAMQEIQSPLETTNWNSLADCLIKKNGFEEDEVLKEIRMNKEEERKKWLEERKQLVKNEMNSYKQQMQAYQDKKYYFCDGGI